MKSITCLIVVIAVAHLALATEPLRVTTLHDPPYVFVEKGDNGTVTKFEGYVADLLKYITEELNMTFEVVSVTDQYGGQKDGKWFGLIGELQTNKADIAAAALTKNDERAAVVGLTHGFLKMKLQLLLHKDLAKNIKQIKDLAHAGDDVEFGAVENGNTWQLLKKTATNDKDVIEVARNLTGIKSVQEGVNKARQGKFVAILEGHTADYWAAQPPCVLATTEGEQHEVEYVFAVNKDKAAIKDKLNAKLDEQATKDKMDELKAKYWPKKECDESGATAARPLWAATLLVSALVASLLFAQ